MPYRQTNEVPCFWGETNGYGDCVPVAGADWHGHEFCEIHSDILDEYDRDERTYTIGMLEDTSTYRGPFNG